MRSTPTTGMEDIAIQRQAAIQALGIYRTVGLKTGNLGRVVRKPKVAEDTSRNGILMGSERFKEFGQE
ncbi:hypothetical protein EVAR_73699_1 [Eumeta japonica]|uniref:Uncharacterized protein n=1 Tax=Eumeta variegata TaxID=151549 RepID=A0A4C1T4D2_EUMVA|nr:hypothetical protein EVAR_73699_1 [Eumeta japonica]